MQGKTFWIISIIGFLAVLVIAVPKLHKFNYSLVHIGKKYPKEVCLYSYHRAPTGQVQKLSKCKPSKYLDKKNPRDRKYFKRLEQMGYEI